MMVMPLNVLRMVIFLLSVGWAAFLMIFCLLSHWSVPFMKRKVYIQCLCLQIIYVNYPSRVGFYRGCGSSSMFTENLYSQKMRTCSGPRSCPAVRLPNSLESVPPQGSGERIPSICAGSCGQHFHGYRLLLFLSL